MAAFAMSPHSLEYSRRGQTLFEHGFFRKYTIPKDEERRRSKQNSPASANTNSSTTSSSLSPRRSSSVITPVTPVSSQAPHAPKPQTKHALQSPGSSFRARPSQPLVEDQATLGAKAKVEERWLVSHDQSLKSPQSVKQSTVAATSIQDNSIRPFSLNLANGRPSPSCLTLQTSRKRKRTPLPEDAPDRAHSVSQPDSPKNSSMTPTSRRVGDASHIRAPSTSSLSVLSTTPIPPSGSQVFEGLQPPSSQNAPTSSLTVLSVTPTSPDESSSQRVGNIDDSQDSGNLSDDGVFEEEKGPEKSQVAANGYCMSDDDSSDSELAPIDHLFSSNRRVFSPPQTTPTQGTGLRPQESLQSARNPPRRDLKFSLNKLIKDNQRDEERLQEMQDSQAKLDAAEAMELEEQERKRQTNGTSAQEAQLLSELVKVETDADRAAKLQMAIQRQELLTQDIVWHFFDQEGSSEDRSCPEFPVSAINKTTDLSNLCDPVFREQAFLTGFVSEWISPRDSLPREFMDWLLGVAIYEPRVELRHSYCSTLAICSMQMGELINVGLLAKALTRMGAREDALAPERVLDPRKQPIKEAPPKPPTLLRRFLEAISCIADQLSPALVPWTISVFLRLAVDRSVNEDYDLLPTLRAALVKLIEQSTTEDADRPLSDLSEDFVKSVAHPVLQRRMISVLPDGSPRLLLFKRRLALSFFLSSANWLQDPLTSSEKIVKEIITQIQSNDAFDPLNELVDYRALAATIAILDIAIGPGFGPPATAKLDCTVEEEAARSELEKRFNKQVDSLSHTINILYTRIQDHGASHMLRTTAKSAVQNLQFRLEYGVRTRPKPRKDILSAAVTAKQKVRFSANTGDDAKKRKVAFPASLEKQQEKQADVMKKFLD